MDTGNHHRAALVRAPVGQWFRFRCVDRWDYLLVKRGVDTIYWDTALMPRWSHSAVWLEHSCDNINRDGRLELLTVQQVDTLRMVTALLGEAPDVTPCHEEN